MTRPAATPHLDQRLASLQLSARARRAVEQLGLVTVGDFVRTPRQQFFGVPGCGQATWSELERRVCQYLRDRLGDDTGPLDDDRPLAPLVGDSELAALLQQLQVQTVGQFLALPTAARQGRPRAIQRQLQQLGERIARTRRLPVAAAPLLPESLRQLALRHVGLSAALLTRLEDLGCTTVGHAWLLPAATFDSDGALGPDAAVSIRTALEHLVRAALEQLGGDQAALDWPTLRGRLLASLDDDEREWFCQRLGLATAPHDGQRLPPPADLSAAATSARDEAVRRRLHERAPTLICRLRHEALRELDTFEGIVRSDRLAAGSWLQAIAKGSGDPLLPLRLCAFCWPAEVHLHGELLTVLAEPVWLHLQRALRSLTAATALPRPVEEIVRLLPAVVDPVPRGVLQHVLVDVLHLRLEIDPARGEIVLPQTPALSARLTALLHERGRPTRFEDLLYDYRERYRIARPQRLLAQLRRDDAFLQIAADTWSLRSWHGDELQRIAATLDAVVAAVCARGGKQQVCDFATGDERTLHLVLDAARRDRRLRWLGRGEVCPATHECSQVLTDLLRDFRRAAGEVPMSRFVENQPESRRRLVRRLLVENRLFVFPAPDRIDVLTNYPFNEERLDRLLQLVDGFLAARNGYAPLDAVLAEVNRCDLGGSWLQPTLLGELLRRHGPFEVLPGGFVARQAMALGGWLMRRARNALREAAIPISIQELLTERPELAEFASCLEQLLQKDPLVQTPDGTRFQIA